MAGIAGSYFAPGQIGSICACARTASDEAATITAEATATAKPGDTTQTRILFIGCPYSRPRHVPRRTCALPAHSLIYCSIEKIHDQLRCAPNLVLGSAVRTRNRIAEEG